MCVLGSRSHAESGTDVCLLRLLTSQNEHFKKRRSIRTFLDTLAMLVLSHIALVSLLRES